MHIQVFQPVVSWELATPFLQVFCLAPTFSLVASYWGNSWIIWKLENVFLSSVRFVPYHLPTTLEMFSGMSKGKCFCPYLHLFVLGIQLPGRKEFSRRNFLLCYWKFPILSKGGSFSGKLIFFVSCGSENLLSGHSITAWLIVSGKYTTYDPLGRIFKACRVIPILYLLHWFLWSFKLFLL